MFPGFFRPKSNFYRLPNDWFDIWADVRRMTNRSRILALLKIVEYVIKWTWGYQNYDEPVRISRRDFCRGRRKEGRLLDRGTKLSSRSIEKALDLLEKIGLIQIVENGNDDGPSFIPRLRPEEEEDSPGFLCAGVILESDEMYQGFDLPTAKFFIVPAIWTDLSSDIDSEVEILAVEYFFRHTWGWQGGWDEPCWLDADDVANGRRYRSDERRGERYDQGIDYSERSVRDALNDAVSRGWLVWREEKQKKEYALHLKGMHVSQEGEYLDTEEDTPNPEPPTPTPSSIPAPEKKSNTVQASLEDPRDAGLQAEIAQLRAQVATLTETVNDLLHALYVAGIDVQDVLGVASTASTEESKAPTEESKALTEESKAPDGRKYSTIYTDTASHTLSKTPPPDTPAHATTTNSGDGENVNDQNVGGGVITPSLQSLVNRLTSLETPMSPDAASELVSIYGEQPVRAWLDVLEHDPTVRSVPALLIHKLRAGEIPPSKPRRSRQKSNRNNQGSTISRKPPIDSADDYTPEEIENLRERMRQHKEKRQEERAKAERRAE